MNRCYCPMTHMPDGVHCRWLTDDAEGRCRRCRDGMHYAQPSRPSGRWPENTDTRSAHATS